MQTYLVHALPTSCARTRRPLQYGIRGLHLTSLALRDPPVPLPRCICTCLFPAHAATPSIPQRSRDHVLRYLRFRVHRQMRLIGYCMRTLTRELTPISPLSAPHGAPLRQQTLYRGNSRHRASHARSISPSSSCTVHPASLRKPLMLVPVSKHSLANRTYSVASSSAVVDDGSVHSWIRTWASETRWSPARARARACQPHGQECESAGRGMDVPTRGYRQPYTTA